MTATRRVLLVSIVPPKNDCGVRIVMHRQLVERNPFELHVASNADFDNGLLVHTTLRLPYLMYRLRKSRFGPRLAPWITDYENLIWPLTANEALEEAVEKFQPEVILTLDQLPVHDDAHTAIIFGRLNAYRCLAAFQVSPIFCELLLGNLIIVYVRSGNRITTCPSFHLASPSKPKTTRRHASSVGRKGLHE